MKIKQTYKPYILVGPTVTRPVQDPLFVTCLQNQLYIHCRALERNRYSGHGDRLLWLEYVVRGSHNSELLYSGIAALALGNYSNKVECVIFLIISGHACYPFCWAITVHKAPSWFHLFSLELPISITWLRGSVEAKRSRRLFSYLHFR